MFRKIKCLGVAALAVFAFSVIAASSASADFLIPEKDHVALSGQQSGGQHTFVTTVGTVHCTTATFSGTINDADTTTDQVTITPAYSGCVLTGFGINVNVNMNGCDYLFTTSGQVHIVCPAGKTIVVSGPGCTLNIGAQTVSTNKFTNQGTGASREIIVDTTVTGIAYSHTGFLCGTGSGTTGTYNGVTTMKGTDPLTGNQTAIVVNH